MATQAPHHPPSFPSPSPQLPSVTQRHMEPRYQASLSCPLWAAFPHLQKRDEVSQPASKGRRENPLGSVTFLLRQSSVLTPRGLTASPQLPLRSAAAPRKSSHHPITLTSQVVPCRPHTLPGPQDLLPNQKGSALGRRLSLPSQSPAVNHSTTLCLPHIPLSDLPLHSPRSSSSPKVTTPMGSPPHRETHLLVQPQIRPRAPRFLLLV